MCELLDVYPTLISFEDFKLIYRSTTGHKDVDKNTPVPLNFTKFQEVLLRIAIKAQADTLAVYADNLNARPEAERHQVQRKIPGDPDKDLLNDFKVEGKKVDDYDFPAEMKTVEECFVGLIQHLN